MARLGVVMKGQDVRCLSSTFIVVVLFACVFLLSLQPSEYPTKVSMINLPKDEVVRAQSIPALDQSTGKIAITRGPGKEGGKKNSKAEQKKNEKKANKAKWIKDELPKKSHGGNFTAHDLKTAVKDLLVAMDGNVKKPEEVPPKQEDTATQNKQAEAVNNSSKPLDVPKPEPIQPSEQPKAVDSKPPTRTKTPFSNLSTLQLDTFASPFIESKTKPGTHKLEKKIITWYEPENVREVIRKRKALENCAESACKLIYPLPLGATADAIIFDGVETPDAPPDRAHHDQVFVFRYMKAPSFPLKGVWPPTWNSVFNWTWTYRRDSDIWQPLGLLKKANKVRPLEYFYELTASKNRALAWIPHTCPDNASSQRNEFVEELGKYVRVSEYGPCNNKSCSKGRDGCSQILSRRFFFLLALEDDICKDHVTEVFYRAWQEGTYVVPVVRGGADYSAYFPEGTFIDVDWFDNVKQLSDFLMELIASRNMYSQLLWRKAHWIRATKRLEEFGLCQLCQKLHHLEANRKRYPDIHRWYEKGACKNPRPF